LEKIEKGSFETQRTYADCRNISGYRRRNGSLDLMLKSDQIGQLGDGLYEMRIPKSKRGGVVRIYFCYSESNRQELILLDSELKHETAPSKLKIARKRLRELKSAN
jgi:hypothetical protein